LQNSLLRDHIQSDHAAEFKLLLADETIAKRDALALDERLARSLAQEPFAVSGVVIPAELAVPAACCFLTVAAVLFSHCFHNFVEFVPQFVQQDGRRGHQGKRPA
jgi:hypothetical protein